MNETVRISCVEIERGPPTAERHTAHSSSPAIRPTTDGRRWELLLFGPLGALGTVRRQSVSGRSVRSTQGWGMETSRAYPWRPSGVSKLARRARPRSSRVQPRSNAIGGQRCAHGLYHRQLCRKLTRIRVRARQFPGRKSGGPLPCPPGDPSTVPPRRLAPGHSRSPWLRWVQRSPDVRWHQPPAN